MIKMAEEVFRVTKDFEEGPDFPRYRDDIPQGRNLRRVPTPYGEVVAFEIRPPEPHNLPYTMVPGWYKGDLPPAEHGLQQMAVETIRPDRAKQIVGRLLKEQGYVGHVKFW